MWSLEVEPRTLNVEPLNLEMPLFDARVRQVGRLNI